MNTNKLTSSHTISLLGGSGRSGSVIVTSALRAGYQVRMLVRLAAQVPKPQDRLQVIVGDALDPAVIRDLLTGADTVINTISQRPAEPAVHAVVSNHILLTMGDLGIRRYLVLAGLNVDAPGDHKSLSDRWQGWLMNRAFPAMATDRQAALTGLLASQLDWTLVRLPRIVDRASASNPRISHRQSCGGTISRQGLANFLLANLDEPSLFRRCPFIAD